ncbi:HNH endonuclease [Arthrobacter sp. PAMC25564]|uniref:HNH endonuclease n=1 Tax=Arthrobacter sp. PAMC25564 TaxID=2565366 RepID=UPI0010A217B0|nr:HNH endonuclease [Arthrobacter sp. PAMC25564]QCB97130.1 HNH endonuclease [Arthrobacter sp. PAMC25564]
MATSRTGTSQWKKLRAKVLHKAQAQGRTQCPYCGVTLNYQQGLRPNSAEVDHIIPHARGGQDVEENAIACCRRCNQSKGNRPAPRTAVLMAAKPLRTSRQW